MPDASLSMGTTTESAKDSSTRVPFLISRFQLRDAAFQIRHISKYSYRIITFCAIIGNVGFNADPYHLTTDDIVLDSTSTLKQRGYPRILG